MKKFFFARVLSGVLAIAAVTSLSACGEDNSSSTAQSSAGTSQASEVSVDTGDKTSDEQSIASSGESGEVSDSGSTVNSGVYEITNKNDSVPLGTPEKTLDPKEIYSKLTYTPEMFYGEHRMLDSRDSDSPGITSYISDIGTMEFKRVTKDNKEVTDEITAIPYEIKAGKNTLASSALTKIPDMNIMQAYFQKKVNDKYYLEYYSFSYTVEGNKLIMQPFDTWEYDKAAEKLEYTLNPEKLVYEFSFNGNELTLSANGKSVTLKTGLAVKNDDPYFYFEGYKTSGSKRIGDLDGINIWYGENSSSMGSKYKGKNGSEIRRSTPYQSENSTPTARLEENGLVTMTIPYPDGTDKTYQFVYFYNWEDGLVLTDGDNIYYYNETYSDRSRKGVASHFTAEEKKRAEELDEAQLKKLFEKAEDLTADLEKAFSDAGISVTVNRETGEMAMDSSVLFGGDSAVLTDAGKALLKKFMSAYPAIVYGDKYKDFVTGTMVEGNIAPIDGSTYESGLPLSEERASVVKEFCLSAECGTDAKYIEKLKTDLVTLGKSNTDPIYDDEGNVDLDASRRVSFRFLINIGS